jgi:hypothetical protein
MIWLAFNEFFHDNVASQDRPGTRFPEAEAVNSRCALAEFTQRSQPAGQTTDFRPIPDFSLSAFQLFTIVLALGVPAFHSRLLRWAGN